MQPQQQQGHRQTDSSCCWAVLHHHRHWCTVLACFVRQLLQGSAKTCVCCLHATSWHLIWECRFLQCFLTSNALASTIWKWFKSSVKILLIWEYRFLQCFVTRNALARAICKWFKSSASSRFLLSCRSCLLPHSDGSFSWEDKKWGPLIFLGFQADTGCLPTIGLNSRQNTNEVSPENSVGRQLVSQSLGKPFKCHWGISFGTTDRMQCLRRSTVHLETFAVNAHYRLGRPYREKPTSPDTSQKTYRLVVTWHLSVIWQMSLGNYQPTACSACDDNDTVYDNNNKITCISIYFV